MLLQFASLPGRPWRLAAARHVLPVLVLAMAAATAPAREVSIAVFDGAAPVVFVDKEGRASGIYPELLGRILADSGFEARFVTGLDFSDAMQAVVAGELDLLPAVAYSEARAQVLDYNREPVLVAWGQLGVLPNRDFEGLLELRDRRIGMMADGQNGANFRDLMRRFDIPFEAVTYKSFAEITEAVIAGEVAAGVYFNTWFRSEDRIVPSSIVFSPTQGFVATATGANPDVLAAVDARLTELKADEGSYYYEVLNRWLSRTGRPGLPSWLAPLAVVILCALALATGFVLVLRRAVVRATRELRDSRERYRTVADHAHGWEFWSAPDGRFIYVSPSTAEITGYPAEAFLSDPDLAARLVVDEDREIWASHVQDVHSGAGDSRSSCTFRIVRSDGEYRWVEHRCTRITSAAGEYLGTRGSNIDITERVLRQKDLERAVREKEIMLQEIHHRVKNNLQMVASLVSLQKTTVEDPVATAQLESIAGRIATMSALHSTLYQEELISRVDMRYYIGSLVSHISATMTDSRELRFDESVDDVELEIGQAYPCGLIINEALTNACKHAFRHGAAGVVEVALRRLEDGRLRLVVRDDGTGLPDHQDQDHGGIGFELIRSLAAQLQGSLELRSEGGLSVEVVFTPLC